MSSMIISGDTSGQITLTVPAVAGTNTITFPANTGTAVVSGTTPSLNGIAFPATQVPSSDPNTLDDYEEGTFNPSPTPTTGSFGSVTSSGNYTKIGRLVQVTMTMQVTSVGTSSGVINFQLPFAASGSFQVGSSMESSAVGITGIVYVGSTTATIRKYDWSGAVIGLNYSWQSTVTYFV